MELWRNAWIGGTIACRTLWQCRIDLWPTGGFNMLQHVSTNSRILELSWCFEQTSTQNKHYSDRIQLEWFRTDSPQARYSCKQGNHVEKGQPCGEANKLQTNNIRNTAPFHSSSWKLDRNASSAKKTLASSSRTYWQMSISEDCLAGRLLASSGWTYLQMSSSEDCLAGSLLASSGWNWLQISSSEDNMAMPLLAASRCKIGRMSSFEDC